MLLMINLTQVNPSEAVTPDAVGEKVCENTRVRGTERNVGVEVRTVPVSHLKRAQNKSVFKVSRNAQERSSCTSYFIQANVPPPQIASMLSASEI